MNAAAADPSLFVFAATITILAHALYFPLWD